MKTPVYWLQMEMPYCRAPLVALSTLLVSRSGPLALSVTLLLGVILVGCGGAQEAKTDALVRTAAEPFENLTEISFSAPWPQIDSAIEEASTAVDGVRSSLSAEAVVQVDAEVSRLHSAREGQDRTELALSSVEVYRILVSAVRDNAKIPREVSLLDYAGFRYDADRRASSVRWDDMVLAASFARQTWNTLLPRASSSPAAEAFESALTDMEHAAAQRDDSLATASVKTELDLVDEFETFFSGR